MAAPTMKEAIEIIAAPFFTQEVEWRIQRSGSKGDNKVWAIAVPYITARAVHNRLDEAFDPWGWRTEFNVMEVPGGVSGVICRLWFVNPDNNEWEWKENGAGQTNMEAFKGGLSDAEKRAFEQLGGGRYLYSLDEEFVETSPTKSGKYPFYARLKKEDGGTVFYWGPPLLPEWAVPGARQGVQDLSEEVTGEQIDEPIKYPEFDRIITSFERRPGVAELRGAKLLAKDLKWSDDLLFEFATAQGINLREGLTKVGCIKLRDMIRQEKDGKG